jgi:hypothetical protein
MMTSNEQAWVMLRDVDAAIKGMMATRVRLIAMMHGGKVPLDCRTMKKGDLVVYNFPNNGRDGCQKQAAKFLTLNKKYTITDYNVGGSSSEVQVYTEKGGYQWFNSVMFGEYHKELENDQR